MLSVATQKGRDHLILARASDWERQRLVIRGVQESIEKGEMDADEPELVSIDGLPPEKLEPHTDGSVGRGRSA